MQTVKSRLLLVIGLGLLILFIFGFVLQIATTEAFMGYGGDVSINHPNWQILLQLPHLVQGQLGADEASAAFTAWFIELLYLGFMLGGEIMMETVKHGNPRFAKAFGTLVIGLAILNGIFDYNYGTVGARFGMGGHILFAVAMAVCVGFLGIIGLSFVMHGWSHA